MAEDQRVRGCGQLCEDHLWRLVSAWDEVCAFSFPTSVSFQKPVLLLRFCDRRYLQGARLPEGRWRFPCGRSLPQAWVYWHHQRQGIKNSAGCSKTMSRSEASSIQTIQFHHPSLSALSPLPLFIQSICVMSSFPPFPLFFLVYFVTKKRDRLTRTLYCTEKS